MVKTILSLSFLISAIFNPGLHTTPGSASFTSEGLMSDSIGRQILYNGRVWRNLYTGTDGHQFYLISDFMQGSVSIDGNTFDSVYVRYDIYSDELLILKNDGTVIQLNKELIDSFSLTFNNETSKFKNFTSDPQGSLSGYYNVLYDGSIKIYIKFSKEILSTSMTGGLPKFNQVTRIFVMKDGRVYRTDSRKDLLDLFTNDDDKVMLKKYIRNNQIRISRNDPESFRQVIEYYEAAKQ